MLEREAHVSFSHLLSDRPQDNSMLSLPRWQPFLSLHAMTQKQSMGKKSGGGNVLPRLFLIGIFLT